MASATCVTASLAYGSLSHIAMGARTQATTVAMSTKPSLVATAIVPINEPRIPSATEIPAGSDSFFGAVHFFSFPPTVSCQWKNRNGNMW